MRNPPEDVPGGDRAANADRGNPSEVSRLGAGQGGGRMPPPQTGAQMTGAAAGPGRALTAYKCGSPGGRPRRPPPPPAMAAPRRLLAPLLLLLLLLGLVLAAPGESGAPAGTPGRQRGMKGGRELRRDRGLRARVAAGWGARGDRHPRPHRRDPPPLRWGKTKRFL